MRPAGLTRLGGWAFDEVRLGLAQGLSGRRILSSLREHGLHVRNETFWRELNIIKEALHKIDTFKFINYGSKPTHEHYVLTPSPLKNTYATKVKFKVRLIETGEVEDRYVTIGHNERLTREELTTIGRKYLINSPSKKEIIDDYLAGGWRRL